MLVQIIAENTGRFRHRSINKLRAASKCSFNPPPKKKSRKILKRKSFSKERTLHSHTHQHMLRYVSQKFCCKPIYMYTHPKVQPSDTYEKAGKNSDCTFASKEFTLLRLCEFSLAFGQANSFPSPHALTHKHRFSPKLYLAANRPSFLLRGFPFWASNSHKFDLHHVFSICSDRYQIRATSQISGISQLSALLKICLKPSNVELIGIMSV